MLATARKVIGCIDSTLVAAHHNKVITIKVLIAGYSRGVSAMLNAREPVPTGVLKLAARPNHMLREHAATVCVDTKAIAR